MEINKFANKIKPHQKFLFMNYFSKFITVFTIGIVFSMGFLSLNALAEDVKIANKVASADQTIDKIVADLDMSNPASVEANTKELIKEIDQAGGKDKIKDLMETKSLKQIVQTESKETIEAVISTITPVSETFEEIINYGDIYKQTGENNYTESELSTTYKNLRLNIHGELVYGLVQNATWSSDGYNVRLLNADSYPIRNNNPLVSAGWIYFHDGSEIAKGYDLTRGKKGAISKGMFKMCLVDAYVCVSQSVRVMDTVATPSVRKNMRTGKNQWGWATFKSTNRQ